MWPTGDLVRTPLFRPQADAPANERIRLSYTRAREIVKAYGLTVDDIANTSRKFWKLHTDPVWTLDGAAGSLITIQLNLCAGTLAMYIESRPDLRQILDDILQFKVSGQYCLTEIGHGLDAIRLETTATLFPDGSFELNTPHERAAKFMPPTSPVGIPCVAVVWARALINGEDYGIKPFLVRLNDGNVMCAGVVAKLLPQRGGSHPLNHSITYFHRVRLPSEALLGNRLKPKDPRLSFFTGIFRVAVGTLVLGSQGISALQVAAYITAQYSQRRTVTNNDGVQQPIIEFRTQHTPIVTALAQAYVLNALHQVVTRIFSLPTADGPIRHGIATILKVVTINHAQRSLLDLMERCGAQGLFEMNQLSAMHKILQGAAIAEGDSLVLSIRLATEILLNRYAMIPSADSESLLAKHEIGVFNNCRQRLAQMSSHRSVDFSRFILPQTLRLVEALGHRIAYDAAVSLDVDKSLVDLYVVSCIKTDPAWYVEHAGLTQHAQLNMESAAVEAVLPHMWGFIKDMGVEPYATAPIVSQRSWDHLVDSLQTFRDRTCVVSKM
ncbi:acyl-CoA dehydrogenase NM domain-like protein [Mycena rosella]|uniref:Acyl-CoA dehydrogenase NM domain-like protein n=1 Tax=Mycena rosella TaxID=1033263 RepID=A0AAD7DHV5_MYCRO|nr:acyl-CoA dehydrogenase NM domain-like protein [Mycena rosella]